MKNLTRALTPIAVLLSCLSFPAFAQDERQTPEQSVQNLQAEIAALKDRIAFNDGIVGTLLASQLQRLSLEVKRHPEGSSERLYAEQSIHQLVRSIEQLANENVTRTLDRMRAGRE